MKLKILLGLLLLCGIGINFSYLFNSSNQNIEGVYRIANTHNALTITDSKQLVYNNKIIGSFIAHKNNLEVYKLVDDRFLYLSSKNNTNILISKTYKWNLYPLYFPLQGVLL